jgi:hypothetical protein
VRGTPPRREHRKTQQVPHLDRDEARSKGAERETAMAVELTLLIMCRDEEEAVEILEAAFDSYDVIESSIEEV